MLLDRFGQSNKFWKKSYKKCWGIQVWVLWRFSRERPENVLGTSQINLLGTSLQRQIRTSPGHHFRTSQDVRLCRPRDGQIRSLGDVWGGRPRDVLGTNICWLGRVFGRGNDGFIHYIQIPIAFCLFNMYTE